MTRRGAHETRTTNFLKKETLFRQVQPRYVNV